MLSVLQLVFQYNSEIKHQARVLTQQEHFQAILADVSYAAHYRSGVPGHTSHERILNGLENAKQKYKFQEEHLNRLHVVASTNDAIALEDPATRKLFFAIKGTSRDIRDYLNDVAIVGTGTGGKRVSTIKQWMAKIIENHPGYEVSVCGHSAGGTYAIAAGTSLKVHTVFTFNAGGGPLAYTASDVSSSTRVRNIRIGGDLWSCMRRDESLIPEIHVYPSDSGDSHSLENVLSMQVLDQLDDAPIQSVVASNAFFNTIAETSGESGLQLTERVHYSLSSHAKAAVKVALRTGLDLSITWLASTRQGRANSTQLLGAVVRTEMQAFAHSVLAERFQFSLGLSNSASTHMANAVIGSTLSMLHGDYKAARQLLVNSAASYALEQVSPIKGVSFSSNTRMSNKGVFGEQRSEISKSHQVSMPLGPIEYCNVEASVTTKEYTYVHNGTRVIGKSKGVDVGVSTLGNASISAGIHSGCEYYDPTVEIRGDLEIVTSHKEDFKGRLQVSARIADRSSTFSLPALCSTKTTTTITMKLDRTPLWSTFSPFNKTEPSTKEMLYQALPQPGTLSKHTANSLAALPNLKNGVHIAVYAEEEIVRKKRFLWWRSREVYIVQSGVEREISNVDTYNMTKGNLQITGVTYSSKELPFKKHKGVDYLYYTLDNRTITAGTTTVSDVQLASNIDGTPLNPERKITLPSDPGCLTIFTERDMHLRTEKSTITNNDTHKTEIRETQHYLGEFEKYTENTPDIIQDYDGLGHKQTVQTFTLQAGQFMELIQDTKGSTTETQRKEQLSGEIISKCTLTEIEKIEMEHKFGEKQRMNNLFSHFLTTDQTDVIFEESGEKASRSITTKALGVRVLTTDISHGVIVRGAITSGSFGPVRKSVEHKHSRTELCQVSYVFRRSERLTGTREEVLNAQPIEGPEQPEEFELSNEYGMENHHYTAKDKGELRPPTVLKNEQTPEFQHLITIHEYEVVDRLPAYGSPSNQPLSPTREVHGMQVDSRTKTDIKVSGPLLLKTTTTEQITHTSNYLDISKIVAGEGLAAITAEHQPKVDEVPFRSVQTRTHARQGIFLNCSTEESVVNNGPPQIQEAITLSTAASNSVAIFASAVVRMLLEQRVLTRRDLEKEAHSILEAFVLGHASTLLQTCRELNRYGQMWRVCSFTIAGVPLVNALKQLVMYRKLQDIDVWKNVFDSLQSLTPIILLVMRKSHFQPLVTMGITATQKYKEVAEQPIGPIRQLATGNAIITTIVPTVAGFVASLLGSKVVRSSFRPSTIIGSLAAAAIPAIASTVAVYHVQKKVIPTVCGYFKKYMEDTTLRKEYAEYCKKLGVNTDASVPEINSAYRKKAAKIHPDKLGEDTKPFIELTDVLSKIHELRAELGYNASAEATVSTEHKWRKAILEIWCSFKKGDVTLDSILQYVFYTGRCSAKDDNGHYCKKLPDHEGGHSCLRRTCDSCQIVTNICQHEKYWWTRHAEEFKNNIRKFKQRVWTLLC